MWLKQVCEQPPEKFFKFPELKPICRAQKIIRHDRPPLVLEGTPEPMGGVVEGCDVCQSAT